MANRLTKSEFIDRARKTHGSMYSYELSDYRGMDYKILITCKQHGVFSQLARVHVQGSHCPKCVRESRQVAIHQNTTMVATTEKKPAEQNRVRGFWDSVFYPVDKFFSAFGINFMSPPEGELVEDPTMHRGKLPAHYTATQKSTMKSRLSTFEAMVPLSARVAETEMEGSSATDNVAEVPEHLGAFEQTVSKSIPEFQEKDQPSQSFGLFDWLFGRD